MEESTWIELPGRCVAGSKSLPLQYLHSNGVYCPGLDDFVSGAPSCAADGKLVHPVLEEPPVPVMAAVYLQHEPVEEEEQIPPLEAKQMQNMDDEEETPFPKSEVPPAHEKNDDQTDEFLTPAVKSPPGDDEATHQPLQDTPTTLPAAGAHRVALKEYFKQVKASKHGPKGDAPTTEAPALETFTAALPPKPDDWGQSCCESFKCRCFRCGCITYGAMLASLDLREILL